MVAHAIWSDQKENDTEIVKYTFTFYLCIEKFIFLRLQYHNRDASSVLVYIYDST